MFLLLYGPDDFSAREELARLRASDEFGLNQDVFSGAEGNLEAIRQASETMPFLSDRRLVVVDGLPKRRRGKAAEGDEAADGQDGEDAGAAGGRVSGKGKKGRGASGPEIPQAETPGFAG